MKKTVIALLMTNSLDLSDEEFDPIGLLVDIESAFGLRLSDEEAALVRTMGDLHTLLMRRIGPSEGETCLTTMAFLRLRRALSPIAPNIRLRPSTLLSELPTTSPRALYGSVQLENELRLPALAMGSLTSVGGVLLLSLFALPPILAIFRASWLEIGGVVLGVIALIWVLQRLDPLRFPRDCKTLGDLSRAVAAHNAGALARQGAKLDSEAIWQSLVQIATQYASTPKPDISRETTIFRGASA
ncbi:MAG: hypothetical protein NW203_13325 [Hyphomonadaceae bacterium]|nr:hypothetical protein [Hyphomonadaceae bacterium]